MAEAELVSCEKDATRSMLTRQAENRPGDLGLKGHARHSNQGARNNMLGFTSTCGATLRELEMFLKPVGTF